MRLSEEFAILGGAPAFELPLHVGRPHIGDRDAVMSRMAQILDSGQLTNQGPVVDAFESAVASRVGVRNCVATCNGTTALQLLVRALGLSGEVIVPAFTFIATAHALAWEGATPRFCDVEAGTHTLDPTQVAAALGAQTAGILGVHLWGRPCATDALGKLAEDHGVPLLFDAAQAFGCSCGTRMIGTFGVAEVFSFHATKIVHCFEGGAIVTDNDGLAGHLRLLRNFGFEDYDTVVALGINGKMSEVSAAMGLASLDALPQSVAVNARNFEAYRRGLDDVMGLSMLAPAEHRQYVVLQIDEQAVLSRDEMQRVLWAENVLARRYFFPGCHRMEPYCSQFQGLSLPVTERLAERVLVLPTGPALDESDVERVVDIIRRAVARGPDLARALRNAVA